MNDKIIRRFNLPDDFSPEGIATTDSEILVVDPGGKEENVVYVVPGIPAREPEPITHFDPYQYGEYDEYFSSKPKLLSKMTLKDALLIVCGQARASDFYDEVVEQACQMIENAHLIPPTKKD